MAFGFVAPGAEASKAIEKLLLLREQQERQAQLDQEARAERSAAAQRDQERINLERQRIDQADKDRDELRKSTDAQRRFQKATTIATVGLPGRTTDETAQLLEDEGYGSLVKRTAATSIPASIDEAGQIVTSDVPGMVDFLGGTQYQQARAAEQARADAAKLAADIRVEENEKDRQLKELIARLSASSSAESRALANELKQLQINQLKDKEEEKATTKAKEAAAHTRDAQNTIAMAERLSKMPGLDKLYGAYELRGFTQEARDAEAVLNQLIAGITLPNMSMLKGPASDKDVAFMKQKASRLADKNISEAEARLAITEIIDYIKASGDVPTSEAPQPAPSHGQPTTGRPRTFNPRTGKLE